MPRKPSLRFVEGHLAAMDAIIALPDSSTDRMAGFAMSAVACWARAEFRELMDGDDLICFAHQVASNLAKELLAVRRKMVEAN